MSLIDQFPRERLSREDEAALCKKDPVKVVMHSMREALLYTQRCSHNQISEDERVSLCYQKMMMTVKRFEPGGIRFFAYAKAGLRGVMKDYWTNQNTVRNAKEIVSADVLSGWSAKNTYHTKYPAILKTPQKPHEPEDDSPDSLREPFTGEITHPETDSICARDRWASIEKLVGPRLNDRQRMVLTLVYKSGLNFPQIGKLLGVTRSLVHSIHRDTLKLIRSVIASDGRLLQE